MRMSKLLYIKLLSMALMGLVCLGTASVTTAAELSPQERVEKQLGPQGNAMGFPNRERSRISRIHASSLIPPGCILQKRAARSL
jgi:hypothetical protein